VINTVFTIAENRDKDDVEEPIPGYVFKYRSLAFGVPCKGTSVAQKEGEAGRRQKNPRTANF